MDLLVPQAALSRRASSRLSGGQYPAQRGHVTVNMRRLQTSTFVGGHHTDAYNAYNIPPRILSIGYPVHDITAHAV